MCLPAPRRAAEPVRGRWGRRVLHTPARLLQAVAPPDPLDPQPPLPSPSISSPTSVKQSRCGKRLTMDERMAFLAATAGPEPGSGRSAVSK